MRLLALGALHAPRHEASPMSLAFARTAATVVVWISAASAFDAASEAGPRLIGDYGRIPIAFEPNRGQADPAVRYLARGNGYLVLLTDGETVIALQQGDRTRVAQMRFEG